MNSSDHDEKFACRLGKALYHFASFLRIPQAEYLQRFLKENSHLVGGSEDEMKVLFFGSIEKFEDRWCQMVDQFTEDRKKLQSFHEMDEYLVEMDKLCKQTLKTFEDYMLTPISARSAIKTITRGIFPMISARLQWRALDYFEFYLNQINCQDMHSMYEYTRLLEPRRLLGPEPDGSGIDFEILYNRVDELETRALHPKATENPTTQRRQERYDAVTDLNAKEKRPAQAQSGGKELSFNHHVFERDFQLAYSNNDKDQLDTDFSTSDNCTTGVFHFDDATLSDEEPLLREEDAREENEPISRTLTLTRNVSGSPEPQADPSGAYSDASNCSSLSGCLPPNPPSYHSTSKDTVEKSLGLVERFEQDPFFAISTKFINPAQYFLLRRGNCEMPFKVVRGGVRGDVWSFVINLTYTTEQMRQLLQSCRPEDSEVAEEFMQMFLRRPSSIHKRVIVTKKGTHYKVVDVYIDEEWRFGLERKVTFDELKDMLRQSLRMERGSGSLWM
ncbi:uncharacterized protein EV420DRAFT_1694867 [Desarmillaria tabescens]|uniref:Uncharacterized protein n=1 Tax=Armillaria tabescens TaxID=1929756 RepID=A0AA39K690_ARMTA|nr:uncharacterized protein EV420DRAFT_1694867 [Desarmillaria tabescens]KAK0455332.1 hypothetical protein EV420DRAFT_1694867 [Desarmillaria tabescens]